MKVLVFFFSCLCLSAEVKPLISTYLGDNQRNFYGNRAPSKLSIKWKTYLGSGRTMFGAEAVQSWKGVGWTGQPLVIEESEELYLIQGTLSHYLKRLGLVTGRSFGQPVLVMRLRGLLLLSMWVVLRRRATL